MMAAMIKKAGPLALGIDLVGTKILTTIVDAAGEMPEKKGLIVC